MIAKLGFAAIYAFIGASIGFTIAVATMVIANFAGGGLERGASNVLMVGMAVGIGLLMAAGFLVSERRAGARRQTSPIGTKLSPPSASTGPVPTPQDQSDPRLSWRDPERNS